MESLDKLLEYLWKSSAQTIYYSISTWAQSNGNSIKFSWYHHHVMNQLSPIKKLYLYSEEKSPRIKEMQEDGLDCHKKVTTEWEQEV